MLNPLLRISDLRDRFPEFRSPEILPNLPGSTQGGYARMTALGLGCVKTLPQGIRRLWFSAFGDFQLEQAPLASVEPLWAI